jgi:hypothetical protein
MPSLLRIVGVVLGIAMIVLVIVVSRRASGRTIVVPLLVIGIGLLAISVAPDVVRPVQDFIGLGDQPVGRIITVLVFSVMIAYLLIFFVFAKAERQTQRIRRLIRALSAAQLEQEQLSGEPGGVLVVIPAYNEAESLPGVIAEVPPTVAGLHTAHPRRRRRVARRDPPGGDRERRPRRQPPGQRRPGRRAPDRLPDRRAARRRGRRHARRRRPARPGRDGALVAPIVAGEADFVVGSRRQGSYEREAGRRLDGPQRRDRRVHPPDQPARRHPCQRRRERLPGDPGEPPGRDRVHRGPVPQPGAAARGGPGRAADPRGAGHDPGPDRPAPRRRAGRSATATASCG